MGIERSRCPSGVCRQPHSTGSFDALPSHSTDRADRPPGAGRTTAHPCPANPPASPARRSDGLAKFGRSPDPLLPEFGSPSERQVRHAAELATNWDGAVRRPSNQPAATTTDSVSPEGQTLIGNVVLAMARQAAREAFKAATNSSDPFPAREAGTAPGSS